MGNDIDTYIDFLRKIPARVIKIIGGDPNKKQHFRENIRKAANNPDLIEWELWYYDTYFFRRNEPGKNTFADTDCTLAAYHILAFLHDVISDCPTAKRLIKDYEAEMVRFFMGKPPEEKEQFRFVPFEEWVFLFKDHFKEMQETPNPPHDSDYPTTSLSRLEAAIAIVEADLEKFEKEEVKENAIPSKPGRPKHSRETVNTIIELKKAGKSWRDISKQTGLTVRAVEGVYYRQKHNPTKPTKIKAANKKRQNHRIK